MIGSLHVKNFTVFRDAKVVFSPGLNVILGENGSGKTHLLKLAYTVLAVSHASRSQPTAGADPSVTLQVRLGEKLFGVFRPEELSHLVRNRSGRATVKMEGVSSTGPIAFELDVGNTVAVKKTPESWETSKPVYFPTRELLSIHEGFVAANQERVLQFDDTWVDTSGLLAVPLIRVMVRPTVMTAHGPVPGRRGLPGVTNRRALVAPLEAIMGGKLVLDRSGRFYLERGGVRTEITLIAEGHRKVGMLARLIENGSVTVGSTLLWDEPEANLNPRVMKDVAKAIVDLVAHGVQVILATHSLFLMRELEILLDTVAKRPPARWFGLHMADGAVVVDQGDSPDDVGDIAALDEEMAQSDRFMEKEAKQ